MHVYVSPCQQRANKVFNDVPFAITCQKMAQSRGRHIYSPDLRHSSLLAVNHKATCCQLCVVTCASAACEQKAFILLQLPHPGKSVFQTKGEYQQELRACRTQMVVCKELLLPQRKAQEQSINTDIVLCDPVLFIQCIHN